MDIKETIKKMLGDEKFAALKKLVMSEEKPEPAPETFKDAKLKDGTVVRYEGDTPAEGAKIMVISEEGETPAPDGDHEMEDGTVITVAGGMIAAVKPIEAKKEEEPIQAVSVEDFKASKKEVLIIKDSIKSLEAENKILKTEMQSSKKVIAGIFEIMEKIAELPSEEPIEKPKVSFKKAEKENKIKNIAEAIQKLKK